MPLPTPTEFRDRTKKHSQVRELLAQLAENVLGLDIANANPLFKPSRILSGMFTNIDQITTPGMYFCDQNSVAAEISGLPTSGRAFILSVTGGANSNAKLVRQELSHFGESFVYLRTTLVNGTFPAFERVALKNESEAFTNAALLNLKDSLVYEASLNLYNPANAVSGYRLTGTGTINAVSGAKHTGMIPVTAGETYTFSWSNSIPENPYYSFFKNRSDVLPIEYSTTGSGASPRTFTVPSGANFVVINLKHGDTATERQNFQLELGSSISAYKPWSSLGLKFRDNMIGSSIMRVSQFKGMLDLYPKEYEKVFPSNNLFNKLDLQADKFLSTVNGGLSGGAGWLVSGFIPVVAGQKYTLSGTRARQGISFFATNTAGGAALLYDNTATLPLTVTAPAGANYAVIALESATAKGWDKIQFELGESVTSYSDYGVTNKRIDASYIDGLEDYLPTKEDKATIKLVSGSGSIKSGKFEVGVKVFNAITYTGSAVFNFFNDSYQGTQIRVNGDDSAPVRMMGATVGANHGYSRSDLTMAAHGKTNADIGSIWTDGTFQWVIIQIVSANVIGVTCRTENRGYTSTLPALTHVSGAINTANIAPTAVSAKQWYPMLKNHKVNLILDNQINNDVNIDSGFNDSLIISESYDLMEKSDIVEWLIGNGGKEVKSYNAASALNVSHVHSFDTTGSDTIYANFFTYKELSAAQDLMFTQAARLKPGVDGVIKYYVPRSIEFTHESVSYDFSKPVDVDNLIISSRINFDIAKTETGKAVPDRLIMLNNKIGFAVGYLPVLDAESTVRNTLTSKGIQISNSEAKVYPYLVDGLTVLSAGASYSCVAYRKYFERPSESRRTVQYDVRSKFGDFLFLDWHGGGFIDVIDLPSYLQGRSFEVVEITDNIVLLSKVATGHISVRLGNVINNARLILKFLN